jgi:hypothetical protein
MRMIFLLASLWFAIAPTYAAGADKEVSNDCRDDDGNDRCAPKVQEKMRASYGLEDADALMKAGVTLRRAMYVDGYGRDVLAISFVRKPGVSPFVEIRLSCAGKKDCPPALSAAVSSKMWEQVIEQSRNFDQKLAAELASAPKGEDIPIAICMHSWVVVAEAVDAPQIDQSVASREKTKGEIRRDTEDACAKGLAVPYAFQLAKLALDSLPECGGLAADDFRNTPMLLSTCAALRGDRLAAVDAYALVRDLRDVDLDEPADLAKFFTFEGRSRAAEFARQLAKGQLYLGSPDASDRNNATVKGEVGFFGEGDGDNGSSAPIELKLVREYSNFKIADFNIGARKPVTD